MRELDGPDINFAKSVKDKLRAKEPDIDIPTIVCLINDDTNKDFIAKLKRDEFDIV